MCVCVSECECVSVHAQPVPSCTRVRAHEPFTRAAQREVLALKQAGGHQTRIPQSGFRRGRNEKEKEKKNE